MSKFVRAGLGPFALATIIASPLACSSEETVEPVDEPDEVLGPVTEPTIAQVEQVIPADNLPPEITTLPANNNLDIVDHDGRLYVAFRTAPAHFASDQASLYVMSTEDEASWRYEGHFHMGTDLREPRFLSLNGELHLYFAVLGSDPTKFEPQGMRHSKLIAPGEWTEPESFYDPGFIVWRTKVENGTPYMIAYEGGENIYEADGEPLAIHFLTTDDGVEWRPVVEGQPVVSTGGGSETAFTFMDDGSLVAVIRNEAGDETGWGSKICRAAADDLANWECASDKKKYDSPIMFRHGSDAYLIGRRNVTETGNYDLDMEELTEEGQYYAYNTAYWDAPKRCSVWRVNPQSLTVDFVLDLPSRGDTCFPGVAKRGEDQFLIYNYSSDIEGADWVWLQGQVRPTNIYRQMLLLPPAN